MMVDNQVDRKIKSAEAPKPIEYTSSYTPVPFVNSLLQEFPSLAKPEIAQEAINQIPEPFITSERLIQMIGGIDRSRLTPRLIGLANDPEQSFDILNNLTKETLTYLEDLGVREKAVELLLYDQFTLEGFLALDVAQANVIRKLTQTNNSLAMRNFRDKNVMALGALDYQIYPNKALRYFLELKNGQVININRTIYSPPLSLEQKIKIWRILPDIFDPEKPIGHLPLEFLFLIKLGKIGLALPRKIIQKLTAIGQYSSEQYLRDKSILKSLEEKISTLS